MGRPNGCVPALLGATSSRGGASLGDDAGGASCGGTSAVGEAGADQVGRCALGCCSDGVDGLVSRMVSVAGGVVESELEEDAEDEEEVGARWVGAEGMNVGGVEAGGVGVERVCIASQGGFFCILVKRYDAAPGSLEVMAWARRVSKTMLKADTYSTINTLAASEFWHR